MSYNSVNLSLLGGANGFSQWHYRTTDAMTAVVAAGYFTGDSLNMLGSKDMISIEADGSAGTYLVESNSFEVVLTKISNDVVFQEGRIYLTMEYDQVDLLAGTSHFIVSPLAGYVTRLTTIVRSAVTTGGTLTVEIGGSAIRGLSNIIADAAAAGTVVTGVPTNFKQDAATGGAHVAARGAIELVGDANFATAGQVTQIIEIEPDNPASQNVYLCRYLNQVDLLAATSHFLVSPVAGQIARLTTISNVDVTTGGTLTVEVGGVAVTGLSVVVGDAGGVGDIDTDAPTDVSSSTGTVAAGTAIEIVGDAAFATAGTLWALLEITPATAADRKVYVEDYIGQTDLLAGTSHWIAAPITGFITAVRTVSTVDITTGGDITIELGGVAVPGLTVTVADAGGVGDTDYDAPSELATSYNAVTKGDPIEIVGDAAFATAGTLGVLVEFSP
jgi:hypothetical protein